MPFQHGAQKLFYEIVFKIGARGMTNVVNSKLIMMRTTIRCVAEQAGVSAVTVSNVLRGVESRASEATRLRVLATAKDLNYLPVSPPSSQNRQIETRIVTLVPEYRDITHYDLDLFTYEGIVEGARRHGYDVLTMVRDDREKSLKREKLRYLDRRSDGFIFISAIGQWVRAFDIVAQHGIPAVACYRRDLPPGVAWVDVDNDGVMRQAVEHLAGRGHRRIAYLSGPPNNFDEKQRRRAWKATVKAQGLEVRDEFIVQGAAENYALNDKALASVSRLGVTAAVCFNDTLALALWDAIEAQGLNVPRDLSLIGVDDRPEAAARGLSSVAHSFMDVGRLAMDAWVELKNGGEAADCCKVAPVHLVSRDSVRTLTS